jgi:hypothetical protein
MLKKNIKYTDFNGVERNEDFYFNLSKAEVAEMELSTKGGLAAHLRKIAESDNQKSLVETFKEIVLKSYGEKSDDGKRFIKSKELSESFSQTEAYSELFIELISNADMAAAFVNGIVPVMNK